MSSSGSCQCGNIRYKVEGEPLLTYACYCHSCQKRTGSAFSMGMVFPLSAISVDGTLSDWVRTSDKGVSNARYSCSDCGNIIYGVGGDSPDLIKLQPGTLDDTSAVHAEVHIWKKNAQRWIVFPENSPQYMTQPDNLLELLEVAAKYRQSLGN